jgi:hypothetical protein
MATSEIIKNDIERTRPCKVMRELNPQAEIPHRLSEDKMYRTLLHFA